MTKEKTNKWSDSFYVLAHTAAKEGKDDEAIAKALGVKFHLLRRWMRLNDTFKQAITEGRDQTLDHNLSLLKETDNDKGKRTKHKNLLFRRKRKHQNAFLIAYAKCGNITRAARAAGITREQHYRWINEEEYLTAFEMAEETAVDGLEEEAWRRGKEGVERMKFHNGRAIMIPCEPDDPEGHQVFDVNDDVPPYWMKPYIEHDYSDTLLIFLLKAKRPDQFRDKPIDIKQQQIQVGIDAHELLSLAERDNIIDGDFVNNAAQKLIEDHIGADNG